MQLPGGTMRIPRTLRSRYRDAVGGNYLRLVGENLAARRIDQYFQPLRVVGAIGLVVAEGLDPCGVFQTPPGCVEQRLVDTEVVRISMHVGYRFAKRDDLVARSSQVIPETVRKASCGQRRRVDLECRRSPGRFSDGTACGPGGTGVSGMPCWRPLRDAARRTAWLQMSIPCGFQACPLCGRAVDPPSAAQEASAGDREARGSTG